MRNTNIISSIVDVVVRTSVAGNQVLRAMLEYMQRVIRQMAEGLRTYAGQSCQGLLRLKHLAVGMWSMGLPAVWAGNFGAGDQGQLRFQTATSGSYSPKTAGHQHATPKTVIGDLTWSTQPNPCDPRTRLT